MASFVWNKRQGNVHELLDNNHARKCPFPKTQQQQIACRICNKVFLSTHSLINHIETHMVNNETAAARRQNELINQFATNPNFYNNFTLQTPPPPTQPPIHSGRIAQEIIRNPFLFPNPQSLLNHQGPWPVPPTNLSRKNLVFGPQLQPHSIFGQQAVRIQQQLSSSSSDCFTKPLIDQLQKNIPAVERYSDGNNRVFGSEMLDLTLKL